jgi:PAB1-binding protein PBP1
VRNDWRRDCGSQAEPFYSKHEDSALTSSSCLQVEMLRRRVTGRPLPLSVSSGGDQSAGQPVTNMKVRSDSVLPRRRKTEGSRLGVGVGVRVGVVISCDIILALAKNIQS